MSVQTSYPGVYVQEVPSGVRTIAGVSTSVTAFVGIAKRGPINRAVTITSNADYERKFGGLSVTSEMSYAVRQFFMNGGTQAIIVRLASNPVAASTNLSDRVAPLANNVLLVSAKDEGSEGNRIEVSVNYQSSNPDSLFNVVVSYSPSGSSARPELEIHTNLSMNSEHPRYVETIINGSSDFINVTRNAAPALIAGLGSGTAISGPLGDVGNLVDATHNSFRVIVNGLDAVTVLINTPLTAATPALRLAELCAVITNSVQSQANGQAALALFACSPNAANDRITMISGATGENSSIEILPGPGNDATGRLQLGLMFGGRQIDAVAALTPADVPFSGLLTSGDITDADITGGIPIPDAAIHRFRISIDGSIPALVDLSLTALPLVSHQARITELAARIQTAVRAIRPTAPAFRDFTCHVIDGAVAGTDYRLVFSSGTRGTGSSVIISQELADIFVTRLRLLVDGSATTATLFHPNNITLMGGTEMPVTPLNAYQVYTGNQALRTGIYALESADLFNILCLPGIADPGILSESVAYCESRRAFMIIDAPPDSVRPEEMVAAISGTALPKSDHAAVYYPWIRIANPLNGGQLRLSAPCGTIAGLYARTDASRGVWKAPAGTEAKLNGVRRVEYLLTDMENGILNPLAVNCTRLFPDSGIVSWGGRTLAGSDANASEWKYIPVRRTALYIEESLYRGLKWVVFEPNDEPLWAQIRLNAGAFMHNLFRQGAFQGTKKNDAYFVKCDSETTTQNDINLGRVNIWIGFAPLKPAEFVILYLQQIAGNILV